MAMGRCIPKQGIPERSVLDFSSLGQCVLWMMRPQNDASLSRRFPWTMRPLHVFQPFGTD
jgi:hypothetical protein